MLIQNTITLTASQDIPNILTGSQFELMPFDGLVRFGITQDANGSIVCDVYSGTDLLMESSTVSIANRFPVNPDDFNLRDVAAKGERLKIHARNTAAANRVLFYAVEVIPIRRR